MILFYFLKKHSFKKTAILNYDFNIKAIRNDNRGSVYCFWPHNWHAAMYIIITFSFYMLLSSSLHTIYPNKSADAFFLFPFKGITGRRCCWNINNWTLEEINNFPMLKLRLLFFSTRSPFVTRLLLLFKQIT
jgi:hypothetical protein